MLAVELKKPIAILVPIGSNIGSHTGIGIVDDYINVLSRPVGVVFATGTGNEGDTDTHTEGRIEKTGDTETIELKVDKNHICFNSITFRRSN